MILEPQMTKLKLHVNTRAKHSQNLLPRGSSKVCFSAQKILFVLKNRLAPDTHLVELLPPKSAKGIEIRN